MICSNCSGVIPNESKICPFCNAKVDPSEKRCPSCWAKLSENETKCKKCGCDIEKHEQEIIQLREKQNVTLKDRIKKLPLWIKIAVPVLIFAIILSVILVQINNRNERERELLEISEDYVVSVDIAEDNIEDIAKVYRDMVYGQSWLDHTGSARAVREDYADEIKAVRKERQNINYIKKKFQNFEGESLSHLAEDVHRKYKKCYSYVIGENGKYPEYMQEYRALEKDLEKSIEEMRKEIERRKNKLGSTKEIHDIKDR